VHGVVVRAPVVQLYCVQHFGQRGHYAVGAVAYASFHASLITAFIASLITAFIASLITAFIASLITAFIASLITSLIHEL
jgi:hypothetical protein